MVMNDDERQFVSNILTLLSVSGAEKVIDDDYRKDLNELERLGVNLPKLPNAKRPLNHLEQAGVEVGAGSSSQKNSSESSNVNKLIKVGVKSIKPPRFNTEIECPIKNTIHEVKQQLIESENLAGLQPTEIKLLLKGKVISDSTLLDSLITDELDIKFTAMINKSAASQSAAPAEQTPVPETPSGSATSIPWEDILKLLQEKNISNPAEVIDRLKKGWNLAN